MARQSAFERELVRRRIRKLLSRVEKLGFLEALWVLDRTWYDPNFRLPTEYQFPMDYWPVNFGNRFAIYPWETETLANEILFVASNSGRRVANHRSWGLLSELVNKLRRLEDLEYIPGENRIFREIDRIAYRQFRWQSQNWDGAEYVRAWSIYGSPRLAAAFERLLGTTVRNILRMGIVWNNVFNSNVVVATPNFCDVGGIDEADVAAFVSAVSAPQDALEAESRLAAADAPSFAYRRSVYRRKPVIEIVRNGICAYVRPMELLLKWRISNGLYYDVIGDNEVRDSNLIGAAFERYVRDLLSAKFEDFDVSGDLEYGAPGRRKRSPDVLVVRRDIVECIIECKSVRLPVRMQILLEDGPERERVLNDIARGVRQVCEFRQLLEGVIPGIVLRPAENISLAVVTLDDVVFLAPGFKAAVRQRAGQLLEVAGRQDALHLVDRVVLCTVDELEKLVTVFRTEAVLSVLRDAVGREHQGSPLASVIVATRDGRAAQARNPLAGRLHEFLNPN